MFEKSAEFYDNIYCKIKNYEKESEKIKTLILKEHINAKSILNVACGTGEHDRFLKDNFEVDGLDINTKFIEYAKNKNIKGNYYLADMKDFNLNKKYDVILCLFTSIGCLENLEELKKTIFNFSRHLNENGAIIIEPWSVPDPWKTDLPHMQSFDKEDIKICRMTTCLTQGKKSLVCFNFLVGNSNGVQYFKEHHELTFFNFNDFKIAFEECNLEIKLEQLGIAGRELFYGFSNTVSKITNEHLINKNFKLIEI